MFVLLRSPVKKGYIKISVILLSICVAAVVLVAGLLCVSNTPDESASCNDGDYSTFADKEDGRRDFISQFGLSSGELYGSSAVYIPVEFNNTYSKYNELQKKQGLDLSKYTGEKCTRYVYSLKDCEIDGNKAYITIIVYKGRVIGGHISSLEYGSVYHTFFGK